jgi:hypothetical protein
MHATEQDQAVVLTQLGLPRSLSGMPWAFLPEAVRATLARRVRIDAARLPSRR